MTATNERRGVQTQSPGRLVAHYLKARTERWRLAGAVAATAVVFLALWEVLTEVLGIWPVMLRSPQQIGAVLFGDFGMFLSHSYTTAYETLVGFLLAALIGIIFAILIVASRFLQLTIYPIFLVLQIVPKVAIAPLLIVMMGFGIWPKITLVILIAFFPILLSTAAGLRSADQEILDLVRVLNGSRWQEFIHVRLPNSLPFTFSGLKLGMTVALIGAIIGEFVGANEGLGFLIIIAQTSLNTDMAYAAIILVSLIGMLFYGLITALEYLLLPWARETKKSHEDG